MHQLNDQWTEIIDGQEHMVKAVEGVEGRDVLRRYDEGETNERKD